MRDNRQMDDVPVARDVPTTIAVFASDERIPDTRAVPVEMPIEVVFAPVSFAVMMATPADLEDFALGFSFTEGIVDSAADVRGVRGLEAEGGMRLEISLVSDKMQRHLARGRALSGRTGCGLCGISDLSALPQAEPAPRREPVALAAIHAALGALEAAQPLNAQTRAVHAAAFANLDGHIVAVREDVGRHNALDKLIGALLRGGQDPADGFIVITSRCSFEMVEKAARYGAHTLVAISAPTSLAIERAQRYGLTLVALARSDSARIFNGSDLIFGGPSSVDQARP